MEREDRRRNSISGRNRLSSRLIFHNGGKFNLCVRPSIGRQSSLSVRVVASCQLDRMRLFLRISLGSTPVVLQNEPASMPARIGCQSGVCIGRPVLVSYKRRGPSTSRLSTLDICKAVVAGELTMRVSTVGRTLPVSWSIWLGRFYALHSFGFETSSCRISDLVPSSHQFDGPFIC